MTGASVHCTEDGIVPKSGCGKLNSLLNACRNPIGNLTGRLRNPNAKATRIQVCQKQLVLTQPPSLQVDVPDHPSARQGCVLLHYRRSWPLRFLENARDARAQEVVLKSSQAKAELFMEHP